MHREGRSVNKYMADAFVRLWDRCAEHRRSADTLASLLQPHQRTAYCHAALNARSAAVSFGAARPLPGATSCARLKGMHGHNNYTNAVALVWRLPKHNSKISILDVSDAATDRQYCIPGEQSKHLS